MLRIDRECGAAFLDRGAVTLLEPIGEGGVGDARVDRKKDFQARPSQLPRCTASSFSSNLSILGQLAPSDALWDIFIAGQVRTQLQPPFVANGCKNKVCIRELPDMMSASEGEGGHGKVDVVMEVV